MNKPENYALTVLSQDPAHREFQYETKIAELARVVREINGIRDQLHKLIARGICPHCGAKVMEAQPDVETRD